MKKAIIAITLLLAIAAGAFFGYRFYEDKKIADSYNANTWTVEEMGNFKLVEMAIDNDSLFTDALYALLEKKIDDGNLQASLKIKISDTSIDLKNLKKMLIKISNGTVEVSDSLKIIKREPHTILCRLDFNVATTDSTENRKTNILQLIENLYTRENLDVSVHPFFDKHETDWVKAPIPEPQELAKPVYEPEPTEVTTDEAPAEDAEVEIDLN